VRYFSVVMIFTEILGFSWILVPGIWKKSKISEIEVISPMKKVKMFQWRAEFSHLPVEEAHPKRALDAVRRGAGELIGWQVFLPGGRDRVCRESGMV